ncbi:MAG: 50S ribosomal protein L28 [Candidatus Spechtbacteria bacterium]|nr:50S ribosomal protein L28 [Candidatus Spechtbacteria bacterium]
MATSCSLCGKQSHMQGKRKLLRGNYNPTVRSRKYPNLQWVRLVFEKSGIPSGKRVKACTKCIKAMHKMK